MAEEPRVLERVQQAVGPAAATLFVEKDRDRRFIFELTLTGVALYLLGKYLDGFIEGLGIKDLGEEHGQAITRAIQYSLGIFKGKLAPKKEELDRYGSELSQVIFILHDSRSNPAALASGSNSLLRAFEEAGIPQAEAQRIVKEIEGEIWQ
jgi:hypothetical protein